MPIRRYRRVRRVRRVRRPRRYILRRRTVFNPYRRRSNLGYLAVRRQGATSTLVLTDPAGVGSSYTNGVMKYSLANVVNYTEFQALFDSYKISAVKTKFVFRASNLSLIELINNGYVGMPIVHTAIDYDGGTTSTFQQLQEYSSYRMTPLSPVKRVVSRYFRPKWASLAYKTSTTNIGFSEKRGWVDCIYPDIEHYSLKYSIEWPASTYNPVGDITAFDIYHTYWLKFKRVL